MYIYNYLEFNFKNLNFKGMCKYLNFIWKKSIKWSINVIIKVGCVFFEYYIMLINVCGNEKIFLKISLFFYGKLFWK